MKHRNGDMFKKEFAEKAYVLSSFAMLFTFTAALIYYILYKEILIYLVVFGLIAFGVGFIAKNRWEMPDEK